LILARGFFFKNERKTFGFGSPATFGKVPDDGDAESIRRLADGGAGISGGGGGLKSNKNYVTYSM